MMVYTAALGHRSPQAPAHFGRRTTQRDGVWMHAMNPGNAAERPGRGERIDISHGRTVAGGFAAS